MSIFDRMTVQSPQFSVISKHLHTTQDPVRNIVHVRTEEIAAVLSRNPVAHR